MSTQERIEYIEKTLTEEFQPQQLEIIDDSHKHAGHASARGGGHFTVNIVSEAFAGKALLARHRMVYAALETGMQADIHALSIKAKTPEEVTK
ncbi:MAG: BolA family transcriptional regulator [Gammaproteobacteria bacterium]|nr:BolA family transcriptional regulator [Gammaproteobacteria bacterium]